MVTVYYSFLSVFLPFLWIFYFNKKDKHPEPKFWLFIAFILGIMSAVLSYYTEDWLEPLVSKTHFLKFFLFAFVEEFFKFLVIWIFIFPLRIFDEPIDAMIYMMFAAWAFASLENFILVNKSLELINYSPGLVLFLRFLGANLLHILASALIGYGYAFFVKTRNFFPFGISFISASFLHFLYNSLIIEQWKTINIFSKNFLPEGAGLILTIPILWITFLVVLSELNYLSSND